MTETARPRQNRDGHPCPPWCETDHDTPQLSDGTGFRTHLGARAVIRPPGRIARIAAYPQAAGQDLDVIVHASAYGEQQHKDSFVRPADPEALATLLEVLADATPDQHRELAEAIRRAAAQVTEARDGR